MAAKTPQKRVLFARCPKLFGAGLLVSVCFAVLMIALTLFTPVTRTYAATAPTINFQARLMNTNGSVVADGSYSVVFKIYSVSTGGSALWTETQSVSVTNGYLTVNLGSVTPFNSSIPWGSPLWLTMNVNSDGEMSPRLSLTSVPSALSLTSANGGTNVSTLTFAAPTTSESIVLPAESGATVTVCYQNDTACGFAPLTGSSSYVQLQSTTPGTQQTGNINISGTTISGTALDTPLIDTPSAGTLVIGKTNATTIQVGSTTIGSGQTINVGTNATIGSSETVTLGSDLSGSTSTTTVQGAAGVSIFTNSASSTVAVESNVNAINAFQVEQSGGGYIFNVNTQSDVVTADYLNIGITSSSNMYLDDSFSGSAIAIGNINARSETIGNSNSSNTVTLTGGASSVTVANAGTTIQGGSTLTPATLSTYALQVSQGSGQIALGSTSTYGYMYVDGSPFFQGGTSTGNLITGSIFGNLTTGTDNIAYGTGALNALTSGSSNSAVGFDALYNNTTGQYNMAFGQNALYGNQTGSGNIAVGVNSLASNPSGGVLLTGSGNTVVGQNSAGTLAGSSQYNTVIGYNSGTTLVGSNNNNVIIGANIAGPSGGGSNYLNVGNVLQGNTSTGSALFQNVTNSTTAFQIQNAAGADIFLVDTATTPNLLTYPGFEAVTAGVPTGWSKVGSPTTFIQNSNKAFVYNGLNSLEIVTTSTTGQGAQTSSFVSTPGTGTYTLSFYAMLGSGTMAANKFTVTTTGGAGSCTGSAGTTLNSSGFQPVSCTFTVSSGNIGSLSITETAAAVETIYIDAVQLQSGNSATAYSDGAIQLRGLITNPVSISPSSNSTTALQVQNAAGAEVLDVDTTNGRVGVGTSVPGYALDVAGQINASTELSVAGTDVCDTSGSVGCIAKTGSGYYIQNDAGAATVQTNANFYIQPAASTVGAVIEANGADILDLQNNSAQNILTVSSTGVLQGTSGLTENTGNTTAGSTASGAISIQTGTASGSASSTGSITIMSGNASGTGASNSGGITIDVGTSTNGTKGTLNIGTTNASSINIGNSSSAITLNGTGTGVPFYLNAANGGTDQESAFIYELGGTQTAEVGVTGTASKIFSNSVANDLGIKNINGSGNIDFGISNSGGPYQMQINGSNGGSVLLQNTANSTTAFKVKAQGSSGVTELTVDTTNDYVQIGTASPTNTTTQSLLVLNNYHGSGVADVSGGTNGAMYYNSTADAFRCYQNGTWTACDGLVNSTTAISTNITATSPTTFGQAYTVPAGDCEQGVVYLVTALGYFTEPATHQSMTLTLVGGGTTLLSLNGGGGIGNLPVSGSANWYFNATITCYSSSTVMVSGQASWGTSGASTVDTADGAAQTGTQTWTNTSSTTLDVEGNWNTTAGTTFKMTQYIVQRLGPS
ncbi:MAG TPA: hypothetical protein VIM53_03615 [Candidatus Saccharimonadales bacterium]